MIVTVTLNPTLDRTLSVPALRPGEVHRAQVVREDLGGKGINVSRALRGLGIASNIVAIGAGCTGQRMKEELAATGFEVDFLEIPGETRRNLTLRDEATGVYTKINEPGPRLDAEHTAALLQRVADRARPGDIWAFCGALPPAAPFDLYAQLIDIVQGRGGRAVLDTSGPALRAGLAARPFALKPNQEEAAELVGRALGSDVADRAAARALQEAGTNIVALSRGAEGLVLATEDVIVMAKPPAIEARSPVGAGDAALAGLLWAMAEGCDAAETARRAVACGTAAALQEGTGVGDRALVAQLMQQIRIE